MIPYVSWKGKTLFQITSQYKENRNDGTNTSSNRNLFISAPSKIYRRESATIHSTPTTCNSRKSSSIDQLNMPNGYLISNNVLPCSGLVNTLDIHLSNNKYENGDCMDKNVCATENARRRVRSSGMIKRKFVSEKNNDISYFTNSNQYLVSRNRTFQQNQYNHIRNGEASLINNIAQYKTNVYSPNGLSHCKLATITKNVNDTFYYIWTTFNYTDADINSIVANPAQSAIDISGVYQVVIPEGNYDIQSLNAAFQRVLIQNSHYYINKEYGVFESLMKIVYNNVQNKVELQVYSNFTKEDPSLYIIPTDYRGNPLGTPVPKYTTSPNNKSVYTTPAFYFPNDNTVLGFKTGFYPPINTGTHNISFESRGILSNIHNSAHPLYDVMYYKPNNTRFAVQGAVSSSDRITRIKYDTITRAGLTFASTFGKEVGNALAYGVPGEIYTLKDKYGYPNKKTPIFCKSSGEIKCKK